MGGSVGAGVKVGARVGVTVAGSAVRVGTGDAVEIEEVGAGVQAVKIRTINRHRVLIRIIFSTVR